MSTGSDSKDLTRGDGGREASWIRPGREKDSYLPGPGEPWNPIRLTRWSGEYLEEHGVEDGRLNAELLLAHVLAVGRLDLYLQHDRPLSPMELESFKKLLRRRAGREPLQHVLGSAHFRELELRIDSRALIPRPETEILVDEVLAWARESSSVLSRCPENEEGSEGPLKPLAALEVGTGSGAIALSLLKEGPFHRVVATDPSPAALELAEENAHRLGFADQGLELRSGAFFSPVAAGERFHVVVSNPPYVPLSDEVNLAPEVRDWEPPEALFAGPEGLDVLLPLVRESPTHLLAGGLLALEVGDGQAGRVAGAMEETGGFREIRVRPDLTGRDRVVLGVA